MKPPRAELLRPCANLALVPVIPALAVILGLAVALPAKDESESIAWLGSLAGVTGFLLVWLRAVRWTLKRCLGTGSASAVLVVHLALWQPVWNIGCLQDLLVFGQSVAMMGLWAWVVPLIWWGASASVSQTSPEPSSRHAEIPDMRSHAQEYMRAVALVPLVSGSWVIAYLLADDWIARGPVAWIVANSLAALGLAIGWIWAWRRRVCWTHNCRTRTAWLTLSLVVPCGACGFIQSPTDWVASMALTVPLILAGSFMIATALIWQANLSPVFGPQGPHPVCPACGYNLTGLYEARCPECGRSYTLDELFRASRAIIG